MKVRIKQITKGDNCIYKVQCKQFLFWWNIDDYVDCRFSNIVFYTTYYDYDSAFTAMKSFKDFILKLRNSKTRKKVLLKEEF